MTENNSGAISKRMKTAVQFCTWNGGSTYVNFLGSCTNTFLRELRLRWIDFCFLLPCQCSAGACGWYTQLGRWVTRSRAASWQERRCYGWQVLLLLYIKQQCYFCVVFLGGFWKAPENVSSHSMPQYSVAKPCMKGRVENRNGWGKNLAEVFQGNNISAFMNPPCRPQPKLDPPQCSGLSTFGMGPCGRPLALPEKGMWHLNSAARGSALSCL